MRSVAVMIALLAAGCFEDELVDCGDYLCPIGYQCVADGCRASASLVACVGPLSTDCDVAPALRVELPGGGLAPAGYTVLEAKIHRGATAETLTGRGDELGTFVLGAADGAFDSIEVTLRNDVGSILGYGRTTVGGSFEAGPVDLLAQRPLLYLAGLERSDDGLYSTHEPTYVDLAAPGAAEVPFAEPAIAIVTAGSSMYVVEQAVTMSSAGTGSTTIRPLSPLDHTLGPPLAALDIGSTTLVTGGDAHVIALRTDAGVYAVDTQTGAATQLAISPATTTGSTVVAGGKVAYTMIRGDAPVSPAVAPCMDLMSELWVDTTLVGTGPFVDLAADGDRIYALTCDGSLAEIIDGQLVEKYANLGEARNVAIANGTAYIATVETAPVRVVVRRVPVDGPVQAPVELLRTEVHQVLVANDYADVKRDLPADAEPRVRIEIGAGGALVALAIRSTHIGSPIQAANFPAMQVEVDEVRVIDAGSGGVVLRYRSYCEGNFVPDQFDIDDWRCATETGQLEPASPENAHRLDSVAFPFGRR